MGPPKKAPNIHSTYPRRKYKRPLFLLGLENGFENLVDPTIITPSQLTGLPEEAKALLYTVDSLPIKPGGLGSSRWASEPSKPAERKPALASPPLTPAEDRSIPSRASSPLNPEATLFTPVNMSYNASADTPLTPPQSRGLGSSRWADLPAASGSLSSTGRLSNSARMNQKASGRRQTSEFVTPTKAVQPILQHVESAGLVQSIEPSNSTENIPQHLKGTISTSLATETRSQDLSSPPAFLLPLNSPALDGNKLKAVDAGDLVLSATKPATRLAESFEEFIGGGRKFNPNAYRRTVVPAPNKVHPAISTVMSGGEKESTITQDLKILDGKGARLDGPNGVVKQRPDSPKQHEVDSAAGESDHNTPEPANQFALNIEGKISGADGPQAKEEAVQEVSNVLMRNASIDACGQTPSLLTREILVQVGGTALDSEPNIQNIDTGSSNAAVDGMDEDLTTNLASQIEDPPQQVDSRGYLATESLFQKPDGGWYSDSYDWGEDGNQFAFVPTFIEKWTKSLPEINGKVDVSCEEFHSGLSPIEHLWFIKPIEYPACYPNVDDSSNIEKQRSQTADIELKYRAHRHTQRERRKDRQRFGDDEQVQPIQYEPPPPNPFTPKTTIYTRPAKQEDISGITAIYNHYVKNSIVPEDQVPISEDQMLSVLIDARKELLPFIVAIQGAPPAGGRAKSPETVLGFSYVDDQNIGIGISNKGRSRFTGQVELYVHHKYLRKGIGRCLLDQLLAVTGPCHASRNGCKFVYPARDEKVYGPVPGTGRRFHQILIHRAIQINNDPDYQWLKHFLEKTFFFTEVCRLRSVARSNVVGGLPRFLDVVMFQFEAATSAEFGIQC